MKRLWASNQSQAQFSLPEIRSNKVIFCRLKHAHVFNNVNSYLMNKIISLNFFLFLTESLVNIILNVNNFLHTTKYHTSGTSQMASFSLLNIKTYNPLGKAVSVPARKTEWRGTLKFKAYTASASLRSILSGCAIQKQVRLDLSAV